jgi:hypothetical protein
MIRLCRAAAMIFLAGLGFVLLVPPTHADPQGKGDIKEVKELLPNRKHMPLKGNVIGILLVDGQQVLSTEGRFGPPDQVCFATAASSYRWIYVPAAGQAEIQNLQIPVGENGNIKIYPSLDLARLKNLKPFGIMAGYTLVEVEVNNGLGSPAGDSFVVTNVRILEGTKENPLKTADAVKLAQQKFADYVKENGKMIDEAMDKTGKNALKNDQKPTGPREKSEVMYVTWLPDTATLGVHFKIRISDGHYTWVMVGGGVRGKGKPPPPPPPPPRKERVGTTFGVEFGVAYAIDKTGKLVATEVVPLQSFVTQLRPPPGAVVPAPAPNRVAGRRG